MLRTVQRKMEELNMVSAQDTLLVGVSGGADSVCLLMVLDALRKDMGFSLEVVHVEHGIRGQESLEDAVYVEQLCASMGIECHKVSVDVPAFSWENGMGTEEAARVLRYEAFSKVATELKEQGHLVKVALAHHMEDNAETMLFQLVRGSGLTGMCGMQPVRKTKDGMIFIRPLLFVQRAEIENYLRSSGVKWRTDSTNQELEYSRNYLRNKVLPELASVNEQAVAHMNKTAWQLQEIHDFFEQEVDKAWDKVAEVVFTPKVELLEKELEDGKVLLDIATLLEYHVALQKKLIYRAVEMVSGSNKDISTIHVEDVLALCGKQSGKEIHLPYGIVARRDFHELCITKSSVAKEEKSIEDVLQVVVSASELEQLSCLGEVKKIDLEDDGAFLQIRIFSYEGKSAEIPKKPYTKWLDYDKIKQGFCIRTRESGDYFISDAMGHRKKLKSYFVEEKIPAPSRKKMWLLAQDSLVLWLVGGRISEHLKVSESTKLIIEIEYQGGI